MPSVQGFSLNPQTVAPPTIFNPSAIAGPVTNGPGQIAVPGIGTSFTGPTSTLYNGGTPGNRQMGMFWASESVKQQYVIVNDQRVDPDASMTRNICEGMFLFAASEAKQGSNLVLTNVLHQYGKKLSVMYDISAINRFMNKESPYYNLFSKMSADEVLKAWRPMGVLKNEAAPNRTKLGDIKSASRLVNLVVAHRAKTFNIWGSDIIVGTRLYVICKKVPADRKRSLDGVSKDMKWVLYAYANKKHDVPPMMELEYHDYENDLYRLGSYICVGFASEDAPSNGPSSKHTGDPRQLSDALNSYIDTGASHRKMINQIEMYVAC